MTPERRRGCDVPNLPAETFGRLVGGSVRYSERHIRDSRKSKYFPGSGRQIDYASPHERPFIICPHQRLAAISLVFHSNHCTERETSMSRSQGVLIQLFTACSLLSRRPVVDICMPNRTNLFVGSCLVEALWSQLKDCGVHMNAPSYVDVLFRIPARKQIRVRRGRHPAPLDNIAT